MILPKPVPGMVVRHAFLWHTEQKRGRLEASKDRPAAVMLTVAERSGGLRVYLLPITHSPPRIAANAVEIPSKVKRNLGLDADRSWIVLDEVNDFLWPGFDLRPIARSQPPKIDYGILPPDFFDGVRERFLSFVRSKAARRVNRD